MKLRDLFSWGSSPAPAPSPDANAVRQAAMGEAIVALSLSDPMIADFLRGGAEAASGAHVSIATALRNPAFFRAVSLISNSMGMLPVHLIDEETKKKATDHPVYRLLHRRPNGWQSAYDFRTLMQLRALVHDRPTTALIVRSRQIRTGRDEVVRLIPLDPTRVEVQQRPDWTVVYNYQPAEGSRRTYASDEIFHLRGLSFDGLNGVSLVRQAREAIGLALSAELAAGRLFKNGAMVGGALTHPGKLSDPAFLRLKESMAEKEGAENAGKNWLLEEGMKWENFGHNAKDAQLTEIRKMQVEELARVSGVPRPLLMVDETSWGSGIQALGQFFVQYALNPWFEAWQQGLERSILREDEAGRYSIKYNPAALLRGSTKDQADFFAKALGAGGQKGWMYPNEVRDTLDLPPDADPASNEISKGFSQAKAKPDDDGDDDASI